MANPITHSPSPFDPLGQNILETVQKADHYNQWIFELIKPYLHGDIIEIGAGIGNFTKLLKDYKVTATDYNQEYLNKLFSYLPAGRQAFHFDLTQAATPRGLLNKFDTAICFNVLEHVAEQNQALQNIKNTLKSGGRLIILVPAFQFAFGKLDQNLGHFRRYTKKTLRQALVRNGFVIEKSHYINSLGLIGWWINKLTRHGNIVNWQISLFELLSRPFLFVEKYINPPFGLSVIAVAHT